MTSLCHEMCYTFHIRFTFSYMFHTWYVFHPFISDTFHTWNIYLHGQCFITDPYIRHGLKPVSITILFIVLRSIPHSELSEEYSLRIYHIPVISLLPTKNLSVRISHWSHYPSCPCVIGCIPDRLWAPLNAEYVISLAWCLRLSVMVHGWLMDSLWPYLWSFPHLTMRDDNQSLRKTDS